MGAAILPPLSQALLVGILGWREAYAILGALTPVVIPPGSA